ncbi:MAG: site-specific integrase [Deltaproteobacteria bacterium]
MSKWVKTNHRGIRYREHESRKIGRVQKDKYFSIRFTVRGVATETGIGWLSDGVTINDCMEKLKTFKANAKAGGTPIKMKDVHTATVNNQLQTINIRDFINSHYLPYSQVTKSSGQHQKEKGHSAIWVIPFIGDRPLAELSDINTLLVLKDGVIAAGKTARTAQYVFATLGQVFKYAQQMGIIQAAAKYPGCGLKLSANSRQRFLSKDEASSLLSLIRERDAVVADMAEFSLLTGCRQSELFGIKWQHVSLGTASVLLLDTKNRSDRNLYLTERAAEIIRNQPIGHSQDAVFRDKAGMPYNRLPRTFMAALAESGLNSGVTDARLKIVWHSLRHTAASWLAIGGVDLFKISKILGHKSTAMTTRYSHLSEQSIRDAMESAMK